MLGEHTEEVLERLGDAPPAPGPRSTNTRESPWMPLKGLRVVDFCWVAAGPAGTRILADFGAEVIKVESAKRMDPLRNQLLPDGSRHFDLPDLFNDVNTSKKSFTVDLSTDAGKDIVRSLIAKSDVVTDNYTGGSLARMGFPYEELRKLNPRVVVLHLPGFDATSPWRSHRSLGNLLMAASGLNHLTGFPGRPPRGMGIAYPDFTTPFLTVATVLACIQERDRTGLGREMELSQLSATVSLLGAEWMQFGHTQQQPARPGNRDENHCPHGVFAAAGPDRWVAIAVATEEEWLSFSQLIGGESLASDERFRTHASRKANEDLLEDIITMWTRGRDRWRIAEQLQAIGVAAAPVEDLRDLVDADPISRKHYQRVFQPSAKDTEIAIDAEPIRFAGETRVLRRAPMLGEHNSYVLDEILGLDERAIADLAIAEVIV
jgi:benzylsuccinate CoA-transferase BbsF subunit